MSETRGNFFKRSLLTAALLAATGAAIITYHFEPRPLEDQLLRLHVEQALPGMASTLENQPDELKLLFLAYEQNPVLLAKAKLALQLHPEIAPPILMVYGYEPEFQDALFQYGEDILLPIHYFRSHEIHTLKAKQALAGVLEKPKVWYDAAKRWIKNEAPVQAAQEVEPAELTPEERGRQAVLILNDKGYKFISQFVRTNNGEVKWVQTERFMSAGIEFVAGGIANLEKKYLQGDDIEASDVGMAAVDLAIGAGALKLIRLGKGVTKAGQTAAAAPRASVLGASLARKSVVGTRVARYGQTPAMIYTALRHPSVMNSYFARLSKLYEIPLAAVQMTGWTMLLKVFFFIMLLFLRPLAWLLNGLRRLLGWVYRLLHGKSLDAAQSNTASGNVSTGLGNDRAADSLELPPGKRQLFSDDSVEKQAYPLGQAHAQ